MFLHTHPHSLSFCCSPHAVTNVYFDQAEVERCYLYTISKILSCMAAVSAMLLLLLMTIFRCQSPVQDI
jgi:hypothetical protein